MVLQWENVSTNTRPVTQVALVAVKKQVKKGVKLPSREEKGSINSTDPTKITAAKLTRMIFSGGIWLRFF